VPEYTNEPEGLWPEMAESEVAVVCHILILKLFIGSGSGTATSNPKDIILPGKPPEALISDSEYNMRVRSSSYKVPNGDSPVPVITVVPLPTLTSICALAVKKLQKHTVRQTTKKTLFGT
jgi:hypothetical protein